jgi:hypothetical protein
MLLSFYDTYWDDSYIPENYDMNTILPSNNFDINVIDSVESPATYGEEYSLVSGKTTQEYYNIVEQTPQGIYGLRFEITSSAIGTRNKGRFCIDDIVFSTKSGTANNTYVNCNYSTKA